MQAWPKYNTHCYWNMSLLGYVPRTVDPYECVCLTWLRSLNLGWMLDCHSHHSLSWGGAAQRRNHRLIHVVLLSSLLSPYYDAVHLCTFEADRQFLGQKSRFPAHAAVVACARLRKRILTTHGPYRLLASSWHEPCCFWCHCQCLLGNGATTRA